MAALRFSLSCTAVIPNIAKTMLAVNEAIRVFQSIQLGLLLTTFNLPSFGINRLQMDYDPPFQETYKNLLQNSLIAETNIQVETSFELPVIDLSRLNADQFERQCCMKEITKAAEQWGFFQVINHGISQDLLECMQLKQMQIFHRPFHQKISEEKFFKLSAKSYRWGNPSAINPRQLSWSEAFHISLPHMSEIVDQHEDEDLRSTIEAYATKVAAIAESLVEILAQKLNMSNFREKCFPETSFIRLNRYPPCPIPSKVFGLLPHSDSSFLSIVYQDQVGGLQLMQDGKWVGVKPNPQALLVNIGDLFQVMSNGTYKSIKHVVIAAEKVERFSVAYFYCPSKDTVIESYAKPAVYRKFTFEEYKQEIEKDVKETGDKIGLSRFLL